MTVPNQNSVGLGDFVGKWVLDPDRTSIVVHTKAMWVFPTKGTAKAIEGVGTVRPDGGLTGTLVIDAASIDTKNKNATLICGRPIFLRSRSSPPLRSRRQAAVWQARASSNWPEPSLSTVRRGRSP